jgi:type IV pilus assembly protein PilB
VDDSHSVIHCNSEFDSAGFKWYAGNQGWHTKTECSAASSDANSLEQPVIEKRSILKNDTNLTKPAQAQAEKFSDLVTLLIMDGVVSEQQAVRARKIQEKLDTPSQLLHILQEMGYVTQDLVKATLKKHRANIRIGSLLVELGYISEKQLEAALVKQKQDEKRPRLGEVLTSNKYISEHELTMVLAMHLGFPYIEPDIAALDHTLVEQRALPTLKAHHILPLGRENGQVMLAMADPLDQTALEAAKQLYGPNLVPHLSGKQLIHDVLEILEKRGFGGPDEISADPNQAVTLVDQIIEQAIARGASDIHIEPMRNRIRVRFRKDGSLVSHTDLPKHLDAAISNRLKVMASVDITERRRHQGGRILLERATFGQDVDIRLSFYVSFFGETIVMRLLTKKQELLKVTDLGLAPKVLDRFQEEVLEVPTGVVIITGPTGSGKTTSLYAAINYSNKMDAKIITAEDPVEYVIDGVTQCSINPKLGVTFEETLRHILRQDPDIIVLGEIRDKFSAESAIQAALTGHKVLTTFHTEDTIGGLLRLMNMDIETFLISSTVVSVVAQRLIKKICPDCKESYAPSPRDLRRLKYSEADLQHYDFKIGSGCVNCDFTGYRGRVGVFELLVLNEYVKEAILARKPSSAIRRICLDTTGLITLVEDGLAKAAKGITSIQEVIRTLPVLEPPRPISQILNLAGVAND